MTETDADVTVVIDEHVYAKLNRLNLLHDLQEAFNNRLGDRLTVDLYPDSTAEVVVDD